MAWAGRQAYREMIRGMITDAKNKPCTDCKRKFPVWVMELDHRDPDKKAFKIARANQGIAKTLEELAKTDPVCGNCHNARTHFRRLTKKLVQSG